MNKVKIHFENDIFIKVNSAVYLFKKHAKDLVEGIYDRFVALNEQVSETAIPES